DHLANALLHRMGGLQVGLQWRLEDSGGGQHPAVLAGAIVEDRDRFGHLAADDAGGRLEVRPVRTALEGRLVDLGVSKQVSNHRDMAWLAVVGGAHDRDVLAGESKTLGDTGSQTGDRLKRLGTRPKIGQANRVAGGNDAAALGVGGSQMASEDSLDDRAPLHEDHGNGRVRHSLEYKEGVPLPWTQSELTQQC